MRAKINRNKYLGTSEILNSLPILEKIPCDRVLLYLFRRRIAKMKKNPCYSVLLYLRNRFGAILLKNPCDKVLLYLLRRI